MSTPKKAAQTNRRRRLNLRAFAALAAVALAVPPALLGLRTLQQRRGAAALLREAREAARLEQNRNALGYLDRYLAQKPDDLDALDLKARLLADSARDPAQVDEAIQVHTKVLGLAERDGRPSPARAETRRRLVRLSVAQAEREQSPAVRDQARVLVDQLRAAGKDDAEAHRLLAQATEQVATITVNDAARLALLDEARAEYEKAEALEPGDVRGAELLSGLYLDRLKQAGRAEQVIERAVAGTAPDAKRPAGRAFDPKAHAAALVLRARFRLLQATPARGGEPPTPQRRAEMVARARADLDEAVRLDPSGRDARLVAAEVALMPPGASTQDARRYLAAIPADQRDDRGVRLVEARVDMMEKRPDDAVGTYRAGLLKSGGHDALLTWELAMLLIDLGRVDDRTAELVDQYERVGLASLWSFKQSEPGRYGEEMRRFENRCRYLRGRLALRRNRPAEALALLEPLRNRPLGEPVPARDRPPEEVLGQSYYVDLGTAYLATRDVEKAREAFVKATELPLLSTAPWLALARLDRDARPDAALATLRRGLALAPEDPALLAETGDLLLRRELAKADPARRSWSELEETLRRAEAVNPTAPDVVLNRARYLVAQGRYDDAVNWLAAATKKQPRSVELWTARVNNELARGRLGAASALLDEAEAAAGPQADFAQLRATVGVQKGEISRACEVLGEAVTRVPAEQRPRVWRMLGELHQARREGAAARAAYESWARLEPENPAPRLALVDLALAEGDRAAADAAVEKVRAVCGEKGYQWRAARVKVLLYDRGGAPPTAERLAEAEALVREVRANDPQLPLGPVLEGLVAERRGRPDDAAAAFGRGVDLGGGDDALGPLVALLVRERRDKDLEALRHRPGVSAADVDRLAAAQSLRPDDRGLADRLATLAVLGDPRGFDARAWRSQGLPSLGKPAEAEARLRARTAGKPGDLRAWVQLFMLQALGGRTADAAATLEAVRTKAGPAAPAGTDLDLLRAQCHRVLGEAEKAAGLFADALQKRPHDPAVFRAAVSFYQQSGVPELRARAVEMLQAAYDRDRADGWARRQLAEALASRPNDRASWERAVAVIGPDTRPDDTADDKLSRARVFALSPAADDRQKAVAILEGLAAELPGSATVQEALAGLLASSGRIPEATVHAAAAARSDQAGPEAVHLYAGLLLAQKDADGAAAQVARLERADPDGLEVAELKARLLALRGKPAEGAAVLEKAFRPRAGSPAAAPVGDAVVALIRGLGQQDVAERLARELAAASPRGKCVLAREVALRGRDDEALGLLGEAGRSDPAAAGTTALSLALRPRTDPRYGELAGKLFEEALKAVPASEDPRSRLARGELTEKLALVRHAQGRFADEVALYRSMAAEKVPPALYVNNHAWTLCEELHRPDEALPLADKALREVGPQANVLDTRGVVLERLGRLDEAARSLEAAVRASPSGSYLFHLARIYRKLKRDADAGVCRDRARAAGLTPEQLQPSERADWDAVMTP